MQYLITSGNLAPEHLGIKADLVFETGRQIPGSVQYSIRRYARPQNWIGDEMGVLKYHYEHNGSEKNHLELKFCLTGNMYCRQHGTECNQCKAHASLHCEEKVESIDILSFIFSSTLLEQFVKSRISNNTLSEDLLSFR